MAPSTGQLAVLLVQAGASCFMAGLIWTMQVLNYPLLALIGPGDVPRYEQEHNRRFSWLVGPGLMLALASTAILVGWRPGAVPLGLPLAQLALIAASTARQGAPAHERLAQRFDPQVHARLVHTNWIRTAAWSALSVVSLIAIGLASACR